MAEFALCVVAISGRGEAGIERIRAVMKQLRACPVVVLARGIGIDLAVRMVRFGVADVIELPAPAMEVAARAFNSMRVGPTGEVRLDFVGQSPAMVQLRDRIANAARVSATVLIQGETGTGKGVVARMIHEASSRAERPFVHVDCGALAPNLIESELFGHERGAFTGAVAKKRGLFEVADGGTIFLDEIGDMALPAQAKVLRVLQTGEFTRVGGEKSLRTDCRVVAATNRDLEEMVKAGTFREDLYFRLNVVPIRSPDLAERADDIPLLVESFVRECCDENGLGYKPVDEPVLERLKQYEWPGNVRELRNVVERLVIMSDEVIREKDLPPYLGGPRPAGARTGNSGPVAAIELGRYAGKSLREFREEVESEFIRIRLAEFDWNISRTAQALGIERTNLHKKLRALGIHRGEGGAQGGED
ncbi:MAG TPA: sigma-54 dependent transcriptional regulator [Myxococcota bacterium]|nr:sigma-54 dependent transcriptional regulator [Myxococcota bacterium]